MSIDATKLKSLSILLVDDDEFILETMAHFLQRRAKHVATAADGSKALELFHAESFDIIISDIEMPEVNGYELYEAVRKESSDIPFIFLSGHTAGDVQEGFEEQTLFKPIDKDDLILKIISLLN